MAKHKVSKMEKLQEEEYSVPATIVGMAAATGASAMATIAIKKMGISVKGIRKLLVPAATFGIAHWVSTEAMMAAADETESFVEGVKEIVTAVTAFSEAMNKRTNKEVDEDELE